MFVPLSLPLGEEELGLLPTCYTQGTASIIVICSSEWLRHAAILGPIPGDPRCGDNRNVLAEVVNEILRCTIFRVSWHHCLLLVERHCCDRIIKLRVSPL